MKKTGLLFLVITTMTVSLAIAQQAGTATATSTTDAAGIVETSVNMPFVRYQTPTAADIYCAGFITNARGGWCACMKSWSKRKALPSAIRR